MSHTPATPPSASLRIGQGYDVHRMVAGRPLILGGVKIPHSHGLDGHSDADALLHAIIDAMLGAAGLGDIGRHFPDTDPHYQGADSRKLLGSTRQLLATQGWRILNLDSTIIAQAPKLAQYIPEMVSNIAADLAIAETQVNVKAKTNERLGYLGRGEAIEAQAVVLLEAQPGHAA